MGAGIFLGCLEASFSRVVGFAGFKDAVNLVEQFSHDGDDDPLGLLAIFLEPVCEDFE